MKEITLVDGTVVRVRPVPAYATTQVVMRFPDPEMPVVKIKTLVGEESKLASPGTPEWEAYQGQVRAVQLERVRASRALDYDYGVVEWLRLGAEDHWEIDAPKGWKIPNALERHGIISSGDNRIDYIALELLANPGDHDAFYRAIGDAGALTEREVEAALQSFPVEMARGIIAAVEEKWDNSD